MPLKMYILVRDDIPDGFAINSAAHVSLMTYLKFKDHPDTQEWLERSFRKVTCSVTPEQFEKAKKYIRNEVFVENDLDNKECAIGFCPRRKWPWFFNQLPLWGKSDEII